jgi:DNA-binding transcriptional regulator YiaG
MNGREYRAALKALGLSQVAAARLLAVDERTSRRWALGEGKDKVDETAARLLRLMIAKGVSAEEAMTLLGIKDE